MIKKATVGVAITAGLLLGVGGTAFAGETTGTGEDVRGGSKARSICRFSGLDLPDAEENQPPEFNDDFVTTHGAQSYGQWVSHGFKGIVPSPGTECRGNLGG